MRRPEADPPLPAFAGTVAARAANVAIVAAAAMRGIRIDHSQPVSEVAATGQMLGRAGARQLVERDSVAAWRLHLAHWAVRDPEFAAPLRPGRLQLGSRFVQRLDPEDQHWPLAFEMARQQHRRTGRRL